MKRISWSILALMLLLAIGLAPALDVSAQTRRSSAAATSQEAATVEIITYNCATEPPVDGSLATEMPSGCSDHIWIYSGTIIDPSGIIVTNLNAAFAEPQEPGKLGWQMIGFKQEGEDAPLFAVIAQPIAFDAGLGISLLYPVFTMDGDPIEEGDMNLPAVRLADQGELVEGTDVTFTGWQSGDDYDDDRMKSVETTVADVLADDIVPELGATAKFLVSESLCCSLMGAGAFTDDGRLIGTVMNTNGDDEGTLARPMPEALMVLTGEDLSTTDTPEDDRPPLNPRQPAEGTSVMIGSVVSADTGEPIPDAIVLVFNPGVTVHDALENEDPANIYGMGETDGSGEFRVDHPIVKGVLYSLLIVAEGYEAIGGDDIELAPMDAGDVIDWGEFELATME